MELSTSLELVTSPKRIMVFIDGFNVFHFLKRYGKQFYWLNYKKLASQYLEDEEKIVGILYFTALYPADIEGIQGRSKNNMGRISKN